MTAIAAARAQGPTLLLDAGDALAKRFLFPPKTGAAVAESAGAALILEAMGTMGYAAMAVGERDLVLGVDELKRRAGEAKIALLAANLNAAGGKKPFGERKIFEVGGVRVGVFAVVEGAEYPQAGLTVAPAAAEAKRQVEALKREGAGFVVALMHLDFDAATKLSKDLSGLDFALIAHDGRTGPAEQAGAAWVAPSGDRGRQLGRASFVLEGKGPFVDLSPAVSARAQLPLVEEGIARTREQLKTNPAHSKAMLDHLTARRSELLAQAQLKAPAGSRSLSVDAVHLDSKVADAPALKAKADALGGHAPAAH